MKRSISRGYQMIGRRSAQTGGSILMQNPDAIRAQSDFPFFCEYLTRNSPDPKIQAPHMQLWNEVLLTGQDSPALLGIAGANTDILAPRGAAKSTYLGMFLAFMIGRHTMMGKLLQILYVSYTVEVARPKSAAIRQIIESPEYREIFPMVVKGSKWGDEHWTIDYQFAKIPTLGVDVFTMCCAGLKGAIVSKRCLIGSTMVLTEVGEIPISRLGEHIGIKVATFNEELERVEWKPVRAIASRPANDVVEVRTVSGRRIRCTSDHPFFVLGYGYKDACDLVPGDALVRATLDEERRKQLSLVLDKNRQEVERVSLPTLLLSSARGKGQNRVPVLQGDLPSPAIRSQGQVGHGHPAALLQPQMSGGGRSCPENMQAVLDSAGRKNSRRLLQAMPVVRKKQKLSTAFRRGVQALFSGLSAIKVKNGLLLQKLRKQCPLKPNGRNWKQSLQGGKQLLQGLLGCQATSPASGRTQVRSLPCEGIDISSLQEWQPEIEPNDSPYQSRPQGQRRGEPRDGLPCLSHQASQDGCDWETDAIESVTWIGGSELVYDIEVEGNHNFFANSILVHNSHLVVLDDIIKSQRDIEKREIREQMAQNWTRSIAPTMFDGGRAICLGTRFRADDIHQTTFKSTTWIQIEQSAIIRDPHTRREKSYWDFWSLAFLQERREEDPEGFSFQYQNKIVRSLQTVIDPKWFLRGPVLEHAWEYDALVISIDLASSTKEKSDYTVMTLIGRYNGQYHVLDGRRGRWTGNIEKLDVLIDLWEDWGCPECRVAAEAVAYQTSFAGDFRQYVVGTQKITELSCTGIAVKGDKMQRLRGVSGMFERKLVIFNEAADLEPWLEEFCDFGQSSHDDCVDSTVIGLNAIACRGKLEAA